MLHLDLETRSTVDLKKTGVYVYAEHPSTDVWCAAYAFGDEDVQLWTPGEPVPQRIQDHILGGGSIVAHNAQFERTMLRYVLAPRYGWEVPAENQWVCTAAMAAAMALPRHLDALAKALGVDHKKDDAGHRLMLQMARPRKVKDDGTLTWWNVTEKLTRLYEYCIQDVRAERACEKAMRPLGKGETKVYQLDQRINDRGVKLDLELVHAAQAIVREGVRRANEELDAITGGEVSAVTNHKRLLAWLNENDVATESVSKAAIAALREDKNLSNDVQRVLQLRNEAGRSSVAKLQAMVDVANEDGRARGLLMYHGASTGRWSGKGIQPQNFPRGEVDNPEQFIPWVLVGDYDGIATTNPPILVVLSLLRSMLVAEEGNVLYGGDFSAIEARVLAWLAGQTDLVEMFANGVDVYKYAASKLYGIPIEEVKKFPHRQTGKFQILGCGYGMGWEKAVRAAKEVYGLDLDAGLAKEIVNGFRTTYPMIPAFWRETEKACIDAVQNRGAVQVFGAHKNLKAVVRGSYLYIVLPSGRPLCYAAPSLEMKTTPWGEPRPALTFSSVNPFTKQWGRSSTYGGALVENIVQAVSRDLLAEALLRLEYYGYLPVLSVHDEAICERSEKGLHSVQEFLQVMTEVPAWATGCPIAAEAWTGKRYGK